MVQYLNNNSGFNQWNAMQSQNAKPKRFSFWSWLFVFLLAWWVVSLFMPKNNVPVETPKFADIEKTSLVSKKVDSNKISFDVQGLRLTNIALKEHRKSATKEEPVALLSNADNFIEIDLVSANTQTPDINTKWSGNAEKMVWKNKSGVEFNRDIVVENYVIHITDTVKNNSNKEIGIKPQVRIVQNSFDTTKNTVETGGIVYANEDLEYIDWNKLDKKPFYDSSVYSSIGFAEQYWEVVGTIDAKDQKISLRKTGDLYVADTDAETIKIAKGKTATINSYIFAGPRQADILNVAGENIPGLSKTIDYGWFWFFAQPMLWMLNWLYALVGNYGIAIILMTLILRLLIWPLTRKSYVSTMAMQKMQPELQRVQKLYAGDKARLQMEMMKIYQSHKTSPMSGCLPMLIQIPIFFALYKALLISVPMRSAHFLWISDLATKDPYFILPVLMGITMWIQQVWQTPNKDVNGPMASTQKVMKWMPLLFTFMFAWMPAGLVLYWTVSNLFGMLQMYIIKKTMK